MPEITSESFRFQASPGDVLSEIYRHGAQQMLAAVIEAGVGKWIASRTEVRDGLGYR